MKLLASILFAATLPAQDPGAAASAAELEQQFTAAQRQWNVDYRAALASKDEAAIARFRATRPQTTFVPQFEAGARAHAGAEAAVPYLVWLVQRGGGSVSLGAMRTLMQAHIASPGIRLAVARIGVLKQQWGVELSRDWLDRVLADNADPHVLAQARFTRAAMYVGTRAVATSPELRDQAIADLEAARELLAAVEGGASLAGLAARLLDEANRLEPGLVAPEIVGEDLDGVAFKLSDYRGKVVLLDFWGDW